MSRPIREPALFVALAAPIAALLLATCDGRRDTNGDRSPVVVPSKGETSSEVDPRSWLKENIDAYSRFTASIQGERITMKAYGLSFDRCTMSYHSQASSSATIIFDWTLSCDLRDLDPANIRLIDDDREYPGKGLLMVPTRGGKKGVSLAVNEQLPTVKGTAKSKKLDAITFPFDDKGLADRVAKALAEEITRCRSHGRQ